MLTTSVAIKVFSVVPITKYLVNIWLTINANILDHFSDHFPSYKSKCYMPKNCIVIGCILIKNLTNEEYLQNCDWWIKLPGKHDRSGSRHLGYQWGQ